MRAGLALVISVAACDAPQVLLPDASAPSDAATDTFTPYFPDARRVLDDGRVCEGHDEDLDGWPDVCDTCPGIPNPKQEAGSDGIGLACAPTALTGTLHRSRFDPLNDLSTWITGGDGGFSIDHDSQPDDFLGGTTKVTSGHGYTGLAIRTEPYDTTKGLVVIAALDATGGVGADKAGVFVRASGAADAFVGCYVSHGGTGELGLVQTDPSTPCWPSRCPLSPASEVKVSPRPGWKRPTLRVVAKNAEGGGGTVTCELFDAVSPPPSDAGVDPSSPHVVVATIDAAHWGGADDVTRRRVGFFAQNTIGTFWWLDVLSVE